MAPYFDREEPSAKCSGFVVGGRFDGDIWGKEQHYNLTPAQFQERYGLDRVRDADNIRPVTALRSDLVPYAIVTPDGRWHECKEMDDAQWRSKVLAILEEHSECLAVAVDCHT